MKKKVLLAVAVTTAVTAVTASGVMFRYLSDLAVRRMQPKMPMPVRRRVCRSQQEDLFKDLMDTAIKNIEGIPYEEVTLKSHDGFTFYARLYRAEEEKRAVVFFHGWRSSWQKDFGLNVPRLLSSGCSLLLVDQRCHGKSEGAYITYGIQERYDCLHWVEQAVKLFPALPLYLWGVSMGATTVLLAGGLSLPPQVKGIIADCGYTSPEDIMLHLLKKSTLFGAPMLIAVYRDHFMRHFGFDIRCCSTKEALAKSDLPLLFFHGREDDFVPLVMTRQNYAAAKGEKELTIIDGAAHGKCFFVDGDTCLQKVTVFFEKYDR
ncbi:MAG TPA: alpha/beta fold hydrolase [Clostridiales bacterium]|nr:alpha/beta fold hydrolase [Clostridiales bacterium]